jgi:hypothetical protein
MVLSLMAATNPDCRTSLPRSVMFHRESGTLCIAGSSHARALTWMIFDLPQEYIPHLELEFCHFFSMPDRFWWWTSGISWRSGRRGADSDQGDGPIYTDSVLWIREIDRNEG